MKRRIFILMVFILLFIISMFLGEYTGFVVYQPVQPDLELDLTKATYSSGDELDGYLTIIANGPVREDTTIKLEIDGEKTEELLTSLLSKLMLNYDVEPGTTILENEATEKTLAFSSAGSKEVAIKIPKEATINSINFKITGTNVKFPTLDFFSDGTKELIYLGNSLNWSTEKLFSSSLNLGASLADVKLNKSFYYCELIDLPYSSSFKIVSKYDGNLKGKILPIEKETSLIIAKSYTEGCNFAKQTDWSYCDLTLAKPIYGEHFVCIYTTDSNTFSKVEQSSPFSGYKCEIQYVESVTGDICKGKSLAIGDFLIGVQKRNYEGKLDGPILLLDYAKESLLEELNEYISDCEDDLCAIPIKVSSESAGTIKLSDLSAVYGDYSTNKFFDSSVTYDTIYQISDENITNITIPLYLFNITVPDITADYENLTLKATVGSEAVSEKIGVYKIKTLSLEETKEALEDYTQDQSDIAKVYGTDADLALINLEEFETKIQDIEDSNLTDSEKQEEIDLITQEADEYLATIPISIKILRSVKNVPVGSSTVEDSYLLEDQRAAKQEIQNLQSEVNIKADILRFKIKFKDSEEEKTLIRKTIDGDLDNVYVIEKIPKSFAQSIDEVKLGTDDYEIIEEDPAVRWFTASLPFTIIYSLPSEVKSVKEFSTLVIPKEVSSEPGLYEKVRCGDGKCYPHLEDEISCPEDCAGKINWWVLVFLIIFLVAGIYYFNFYKGKWSFKEITEKHLFKSKTDEINLINYIKKSIGLKMSKMKIKEVLIAKGWTEAQIEYAFNKVYKV